MSKHLQKEERIKIQTLLDVGKSIEIYLYISIGIEVPFIER